MPETAASAQHVDPAKGHNHNHRHFGQRLLKGDDAATVQVRVDTVQISAFVLR